jgi:hypothetical protein
MLVQKILLMSALFLMLAGPVAASEYLVNGDFEQALDVGWIDTAKVEVGTYSFERSDTFGQPTPGYAAKAYKMLARYASIYQTVDVPDVNLTLSVDARLKIGGGSSTCWPVASVWVRYADSSGLELGNTRICRSSVYSTWTKSDSVSVIEISDTTGAWNNYKLNLKQELTTHLAGINPDAVKKITIDLFAYDNGT